MEFLDDLDLDSEDVTEVSVLVLVVVLAIVVVVVLCCHLKKRTDERRKREELVEEAGSFFSFHEALPNSVPSEPGPLATFFKASVFSLSGNKMYPGLPYTTMAQTAAHDVPGGGAMSQSSVLLGPGQHVSTPIFPPSYFGPAHYSTAPNPTRSAPPPPYLERK